MDSMPIDPHSANDFAKQANEVGIISAIIGVVAIPIRYFAPVSRVKHLEKKVEEHIAEDKSWQSEFKTDLKETLKEHNEEMGRQIQNQFEKIDNFINIFQTVKAMKEADKNHPEG